MVRIEAGEEERVEARTGHRGRWVCPHIPSACVPVGCRRSLLQFSGNTTMMTHFRSATQIISQGRAFLISEERRQQAR
jgi:hypothetical protein